MNRERIAWEEGKYYTPHYLRLEYYKPISEIKDGGRPGRRDTNGPVLKLLGGEVFERFDTAYNAAVYEGISPTTIYKRIKKQRPIHGFTWEYETP